MTVTQIQENSLIKTNQEKLNTELAAIETCSILSVNKLENLEQLMQDKHSSVIESIDYDQKELFEIHNQASQLMNDMKAQEDALNKHSNELMNELEDQNKKMLSSIKIIIDNQTTQIVSDQQEIHIKEKESTLINWKNQKECLENLA
jgi:hypothetical protein